MKFYWNCNFFFACSRLMHTKDVYVKANMKGHAKHDIFCESQVKRKSVFFLL